MRRHWPKIAPMLGAIIWMTPAAQGREFPHTIVQQKTRLNTTCNLGTLNMVDLSISYLRRDKWEVANFIAVREVGNEIRRSVCASAVYVALPPDLKELIAQRVAVANRCVLGYEFALSIPDFPEATRLAQAENHALDTIQEILQFGAFREEQAKLAEGMAKRVLESVPMLGFSKDVVEVLELSALGAEAARHLAQKVLVEAAKDEAKEALVSAVDPSKWAARGERALLDQQYGPYLKEIAGLHEC